MLTWALLLIAHALPFVVIPAGVALNVALNALFTYKLGKSCIRLMPTASMHSSGLFNLITRISSESLATDPSAEKWRSVALAEGHVRGAGV